MTFVHHRFELDSATTDLVRSMKPDFGYNGFGEIIFYRTYSRERRNNNEDSIGQENWADVMIRSTVGTFSIRKDWYLKNRLAWDEAYWQQYARKFILSMYNMYWLPPGRGLWAMGTDYVYERGSMALYNCASTWLANESLANDIGWGMDCLMCGVGVGYGVTEEPEIKVYEPKGTYVWVIPDTKEGWVESVYRRIIAYLLPRQKKPNFIYDKIRPAGTPIKGFGGVCSGYIPLERYHHQVDQFFHYYLGDMPGYDTTLLKADLANGSGCCVVSGNVRRSAEILVGKIINQTFCDLKDYTIYPYREEIGWMSNNSVLLKEDSDFEQMAEIADRVVKNGEPGYINLRNTGKGRIGKRDKVRKGWECLPNPCGEIMLAGLIEFIKRGYRQNGKRVKIGYDAKDVMETSRNGQWTIKRRLDKEVCNLAETAPTRCPMTETWYDSCEFATFYCSTVALLPTHSPETNRVVMRNRKIGVSIVDVTGWIAEIGAANVTKALRRGYKCIRKFNRKLADEAGVQPSNRLTTIKPGGTIPQLMGRQSGMRWPPFKQMIRRIRVQQGGAIDCILQEAGIPFEEDKQSLFTNVFEYPVKPRIASGLKTVETVSLWEQANLLCMLQREWADNAVSNTLMFRPKWQLVKETTVACPHCGFFCFPEDMSPGQMQNYSCAKCNCNFTPCEIINQKVQEFCLTDKEIQMGETVDGDFKTVITKKGGTVRKIKVYEYDPNHEEDIVEPVLASIAPLTKSVALLPHSAKGAYPQMPEEGISEQEYQERLQQIKPIDWSSFCGSDGMDERYCTAEACEVPRR